MLIDLVKDLDSLRPGSLRCGDLDMLDRVCSWLAKGLDFSLGDGDRDMLVDIVDTDADEGEADRILLGAPRISGSSLCLSRFRPLSCSAFASCSSATPFLQFHVSKRLNHHFREEELRQLINCGGKKYELSEQLLRYVTCQFWHKLWIQKLLCPGRTRNIWPFLSNSFAFVTIMAYSWSALRPRGRTWLYISLFRHFWHWVVAVAFEGPPIVGPLPYRFMVRSSIDLCLLNKMSSRENCRCFEKTGVSGCSSPLVDIKTLCPSLPLRHPCQT